MEVERGEGRIERGIWSRWRGGAGGKVICGYRSWGTERLEVGRCGRGLGDGRRDCVASTYAPYLKYPSPKRRQCARRDLHTTRSRLVMALPGTGKSLRHPHLRFPSHTRTLIASIEFCLTLLDTFRSYIPIHLITHLHGLLISYETLLLDPILQTFLCLLLLLPSRWFRLTLAYHIHSS